MANTGTVNRNRLWIVTGVFFVTILLFSIYGIGRWQIFRAQEMVEKASDQWYHTTSIAAQRGAIYDINGLALATSAASNTVVVIPNEVKEQEDKVKLSKQLAEILDMDAIKVLDKLNNEQYAELWLKRQITQEQTDAINNLNTDAVRLIEEMKRYYPNGSFLSQVLGFTILDGDGIDGLEAKFNTYLMGKDGSLITATDEEGRTITYSSPDVGSDLILTIDVVIQKYLEETLSVCMTEQEAQSAYGIVMDPYTGRILALANYPSYDNNEPPTNDADLLGQVTKNRVVSNEYEPGMMFSMITMASAIESNLITANSTFNCDGYTTVDGNKISCLSHEAHGVQDLVQVGTNSCVPPLVQMSLGMGLDDFYDSIYNFGFGSKTLVQLYGESDGYVTEQKYVRDVDLANIGLGKSIEVTSLQMINAMSSIINGGNLMKPYIVDSIVDSKDEVLLEYENEIQDRVISESTSTLMRNILGEMVDDGHGYNAALSEWSVGGISGTSQKYDDDGQVLHDTHISSYIGFAPLDTPEYIVMIVVDEPGTGVDYGSVVAAPYVGDVLEQILVYKGISKDRIPVNPNVGTNIVMPSILGMSVENAKLKLDEEGINYMIEGASGNVIAQSPIAGATVNSYDNAHVYLRNIEDVSTLLLETPDVVGMTLTEAYELLKAANLDFEIDGSGGIIIGQQPTAGAQIYPGETVVVMVERE